MPQLPPFLSFDPSISAEIRATERGVADARFDTRRQRKQSRQDYYGSRRDLLTDRKRGRQDIRLNLSRSLEGIGQQREDVQTTRERGRSDFDTQLANLTRSYAQRRSTQGQQMNAAGIMGSGALRAAAAQRSENFALDRAPLDTSLSRLNEDAATALQRLMGSSRDIRQDARIDQRRLGQDVRHDLNLNKQQFGRTRQALATSLQRAIREGTFAKSDLTNQAIFQSRQLRPGLYGRSA